MLDRCPKSIWNYYYEDKLPVPHLLRNDFHEKWIRVHFFKEARWPDTADMFNRAIGIIENVSKVILNANIPVVAISSFPLELRPRARERVKRVVANNILRKNSMGGCDFQESEVEDERWHIGFSNLKFDFASLRKEMIYITSQRKSIYVLFLNSKTGDLFSPYDGGCDIILYSGKRKIESNVGDACGGAGERAAEVLHSLMEKERNLSVLSQDARDNVYENTNIGVPRFLLEPK